ncbi:GntR family transcriptional regulator [Rhodovibrionaceae bacterium A322]
MPVHDPSETEHMAAYQQVIEHLRDKIEKGAFQEDIPLPSERTLAEQFSISRMTARRALLALEVEGLAYSAGRRGRFVSPQRLTYDISKTVSISAHAAKHDLGLEIKMISQAKTRADPLLADKLAVQEGAELYRYSRLFLLKGHPAFIEEEHAIADLFPGLFDHDLKQSTTVLMERAYGIAPRFGDISIRMRALSKEESQLLGVATYNAGIALEQAILDADNRPYCFGRQIWRGELAEFTARAMVGER